MLLKSYLCLKQIGDEQTVEGQTYTVSCEMQCGDEVELVVQREPDKDSCIHVREVEVFGVPEIGELGDVQG